MFEKLNKKMISLNRLNRNTNYINKNKKYFIDLNFFHNFLFFLIYLVTILIFLFLYLELIRKSIIKLILRNSILKTI